MIVWDKPDVARKGNDRGVDHPAHEGYSDTFVLADKTKKYKAGTIMKYVGTTDFTITPAAVEDSLCCVLLEDSDGKNAEVRAKKHGTVVAGRLIDASGSSEAKASVEMMMKLEASGIYPIQAFDKSVKNQ